jgi:hypothetical protein
MDPPEVARGIRGHGGTGKTPLPWRSLELAQPHLPVPPEAVQKLTINLMQFCISEHNLQQHNIAVQTM